MIKAKSSTSLSAETALTNMRWKRWSNLNRVCFSLYLDYTFATMMRFKTLRFMLFIQLHLVSLNVNSLKLFISLIWFPWFVTVLTFEGFISSMGTSLKTFTFYGRHKSIIFHGWMVNIICKRWFIIKCIGCTIRK